jgi:Ala-tRNA(Pro) deacylase
MASATWVRNELEQRGIVYEDLHHPEAYTAQQLAEREHISGHRVAKVVCIVADDKPVELVLPASRRVRLDWAGELLHARDVRLASEKELGQFFTDCEVGAIPALRHWKGVDVIMDGHLRCDGDIYILGGTHRDAIRIRFDDWMELVNPRVECFSEPADARTDEPSSF